MVRLTKAVTNESPVLAQPDVHWLLTAFNVFSGISQWPRELQEQAWHTVWPHIKRPWLGTLPGTRPYAWWLFVAPEMRRQIGGPPLTVVEDNESYFDTPQLTVAPFGQVWESEADYLERLNLWDRGEKARYEALSIEPDEWDAYERAQIDQILMLFPD